MDFTGKTAIVTGAARGLGFSYARELARLGAQVVISDIGADTLGDGADPQVVQAAALALQGEGLRVVGHAGDLSGEAGCRALIECAITHFGQLDILIHNAGWVGYQPIEAADEAFIRRAMGVNVYAPIWLCKHAWQHLTRSAAPRIVLTTSDRAMYTRYVQPGLAAYSAGKMAQLGIMNALSGKGGGRDPGQCHLTRGQDPHVGRDRRAEQPQAGMGHAWGDLPGFGSVPGQRLYPACQQRPVHRHAVRGKSGGRVSG